MKMSEFTTEHSSHFPLASEANTELKYQESQLYVLWVCVHVVGSPVQPKAEGRVQGPSSGTPVMSWSQQSLWPAEIPRAAKC